MAGNADVEKMRANLTDLGADNGGQRSEVGSPYSGDGGVRRGVERRMNQSETRGAKVGFSLATVLALVVLVVLMAYSISLLFMR